MVVKKTIKKRTRTTISEKVDAKPILPSDERWSVIETGRGRRHNHVSEALNEMLQIAVQKGYTTFQLEVDNPFTITQCRYWAKNKNNSDEGYEYLSTWAKNDATLDKILESNHLQVGINEEARKIQVQLVYRNKKK